MVKEASAVGGVKPVPSVRSRQEPSASAGRSMDRTLRCQHCRLVIGLYEPMIVLADGEARRTSRAAEHDRGELVGECYHHACYAQAYGQNPDLD
jgi:hypothetical protein